MTVAQIVFTMDLSRNASRRISIMYVASNCSHLSRALLLGFVLVAFPLAARGTDCLYMVDVLSGPLLILNTDDLSIEEVPLDLAARSVVVHGQTAYVAHFIGGFPFPSEIAVVDLASRRVSMSIVVGDSAADVEVAREKLYVASAESERLDVIDLRTYESTQIGGFRFPTQLTVTPDESTIFVGCQGGRIDKLDTSTDALTNGVRIPGGVTTVFTDGEDVLVGTEGGVQVFDRDLVDQATRYFDGFLISDVVQRDGHVYATTLLNFGLFLIDRTVVDLEPNLAIRIDLNDVRISADGRTAYVSGPTKLYLVDTEGRRLRRVIETGGNYTSIELAECPPPMPTAPSTATHSPTATASPSPTRSSTPSSTSTSTVTVLPTSSPTPSPSNTATTTPTTIASGSSDDGCAIVNQNGAQGRLAQFPMLLLGLLTIFVARISTVRSFQERSGSERSGSDLEN